MSAVLSQNPTAISTLPKELAPIFDRLQAAGDVDEALTGMVNELCKLFDAERFTIYGVGDGGKIIVSRVKVGLNSFRDLKLPVAPHSVAGFCAMSKRVLNIKDVYDAAELKRIHPSLRFLQEVDKRTGLRSKQMLVVPMVDDKNELWGVVQFINTRSGGPFDPQLEQLAVQFAGALTAVYKQRRDRTGLNTKYDSLVADGIITAAEFELATRSARKKGVDLEEVLIEEFNVKLPELGAAYAKFFGVNYEPYKPDRIKPAVLLRNLKREYVEANEWLPVEETKEGLRVICLDPEKIKSSRIVNNIFPRHKIRYAVTTHREFRDTLNQFFGIETDLGDIGDLLGELSEEESDEFSTADDLSAAADNELVKLVNKIIIDAYHQGASDIHIESYPGKAKTEIRFRRDGSLVPYIEVPASYRNALVARIKIMCDLDISERRKPQDGKIKFKKFGPLDIELRVATIPVQGGVEDVVMRILAAGEPIPLDKLGLTTHNLNILKDLISKPYGLFFVCGPTGSGKTTTLHSILGYRNTPDTKIWTAEDPVEITQKGLRQVQVNRKAGLDFATVMRAFLRADPDIIMVGEMRDKETTAIGIEASLTGHLVFATLHTNSAPESIVRLLDMGMDPFNFADALIGILAQRLAKRLCVKCKEAYTPSAEEVKALLSEYCQELLNTPTFKKDPKAAYEAVYKEWVQNYADANGQFTLYRKVGCEVCGHTGYKGRVGLHELLVCTDAIKKHIQEHARVADILATALNEGMRTLKKVGIEKVLDGITVISQVRAVCIK